MCSTTILATRFSALSKGDSYTSAFVYPHKKSNGFRSGERKSQARSAMYNMAFRKCQTTMVKWAGLPSCVICLCIPHVCLCGERYRLINHGTLAPGRHGTVRLSNILATSNSQPVDHIPSDLSKFSKWKISIFNDMGLIYGTLEDIGLNNIYGIFYLFIYSCFNKTSHLEYIRQKKTIFKYQGKNRFYLTANILCVSD